jgi:hypothetical protein
LKITREQLTESRILPNTLIGLSSSVGYQRTAGWCEAAIRKDEPPPGVVG